MSAPQSRLTSTFNHYLGESMLTEAVKTWGPSSRAERRMFLDETLTHARGLANVINGLLEHRAVGIDDGDVVQDAVDPWDLFALSDLLSTLLEVITIVTQRDCDSAEDCQMVGLPLECDR